MTTITYSISGQNYEVDSTKISDAALQSLTMFAASGTLADLQDFVSLLKTYPTAYKLLPPPPFVPEGELDPLDDDLLDKLGVDTTSLISLAMLICLQVERELRKMGLEGNYSQIDLMEKQAVDERDVTKAANKTQHDADVIGGWSTIAGGIGSGAGGVASFMTIAKGQLKTDKARGAEAELHVQKEQLAKERASSDEKFAKDMESIEAGKQDLRRLEDKAEQSKAESADLRSKLLNGGKNDQAQRDLDEACVKKLEAGQEKLKAARKEAQDAERELKAYDESCPDAVDTDLYHPHLRNQLADQKKDIERLEKEQDDLVNATIKDHPAAAATYFDRQREAVRSEISTKEREKSDLETTLASVAERRASYEREADAFLLRRSPNETQSEHAELEELYKTRKSLDAEEKRTKDQLDATNAELKVLRDKENDLTAKLQSTIPTAMRATFDQAVKRQSDLQAEVDKYEADTSDCERNIGKADADLAQTKANITALEQKIGTLPPGKDRGDAEADLSVAKSTQRAQEARQEILNGKLETDRKILNDRKDELESAKSDLESNELYKLQAAEKRAETESADAATLKSKLNKQEADLRSSKDRRDAELDARQKEVDDKLQEVKHIYEKNALWTERAAAYRISSDAIGKLLTGFLELGKAEFTLKAADGRADGQFIGRMFDILQIGQGIQSSFADNMLSGIGESRQTLSSTLDGIAKSNQAIAQKM